MLRKLVYFNSRDADTDVGCLNHADIVGTVTNGQKNSLLILLNQFHDKRLLQR
jgi:hypothetical protein